MVGRFVEHQPVYVLEHELAQTHLGSLAAAEHEHLAGNMLVCQTAACQCSANLIVGQTGIFVPDIVESCVFVLFSLLLLKVARLQEFAQLNAAADRRDDAEDGFEQRGFAEAVDAADGNFLTALQIEGYRTSERAVIAKHKVLRFYDEAARCTRFGEFEGRLELFARLLNHFHFIKLALTALRHIGGRYTRLVAGDEVLKLGNLLLLALVGCGLLRLVNRIHFLEFVIVAAVARQLAVLEMIDNVDNLIKEGHIMGNQDEGVLVVLQKLCEPFDMLYVEIVRGLVEQQDFGVLQQQLGQQNLAALAAGKLADVLVQTDAAKTEAVGKFFDFAV